MSKDVDIDIDASRKRQASAKTGGGFFKFEDGNKYMIRFFSFLHKITKLELQMAESMRDDQIAKHKIGEVIRVFDRPIYRWFGRRDDKKPLVMSPALWDLWDDIKDKQKKKGNKNPKGGPARSYLMNIVDTENAEPKVIVCPVTKSVWFALLGYINDTEQYGPDVLGCNGTDFMVECNFKAKNPKDFYVVKPRAKGNKKLPESLNKGVRDLYDDKSIELIGQLPTKADAKNTSFEEPEMSGSSGKSEASGSGGGDDSSDSEVANIFDKK